VPPRPELAAVLKRLHVEPLQKAVAPHVSHYQARRLTGQFAPTPTRAVLRDAGGKVLRRLTREESRAAVDQARDLIREGLTPRLQRHLGDLTAERIGAEECGKRAGEEIAHFYELIYRAGRQAVGDPAVLMSPEDKARVGRLVRDELDYLKGFMGDVAAGEGRMDYGARMDLYGRAAAELFWLGWTVGDFRKAREIRWVTGATEHCTDCRRLEEAGWMPALTFFREVAARGFLPQSGHLECVGIRCACALQERLDGKVGPAISMV
jgi:hypothetical protein